MSHETLLDVKNLRRNYGGLTAVSDLSFSLKRGQILGFLGPNGAGKSSTMNMLAGCLSPDHGSISICGKDLAQQTLAAKKHLGYLPEQPPVYSDMRVDDYLDFCAQLHGLRGENQLQAVATAKHRCGLIKSGQRLIGHLSKGYQQRVGIAQAILHQPDILILDEPTSGLDPLQLTEIRKLIQELGEEHAILLSTHILPEVSSLCDSLLIINAGKAVYSGSVNELLGQRQLKLRFKQPADSNVLGLLDGVLSCQQPSDGVYLLNLEDDATPNAAIIELSLEKQWGLLEMTPQQGSLEEVFIRLTCGEQAA